KRCIEKFGYTPEHNSAYFFNFREPSERNIFLKSDDGYGVFAVYNVKTALVFMVSEALAPREKQVEVLREAIDTCFSKLAVKKFYVQQDEALKVDTLNSFRGSGYRALRPLFVFYWPVFDMEKWHGDDMTGDDWKKLRNIRNRFYREHSVEVVDSRTVDKAALHRIVDEWTRYRKLVWSVRQKSDRIYFQQYLNLIDSGFEDTTLAKTLIVDEVPSTITAGWEIPGSQGNYYSAIGICNYRYKNIGEIANLDDLYRLKSIGYRFVDFGGSQKSVLRFKLKFGPSFVYITHTYAFMRN
ncbi:MAG: hypothetical protein AABX69_02970, partial [Nanoarchaeota archaeon]